MSFSDYLDKQVIEEAVYSYKYTFNIKNLKDLFNYLKNWSEVDYMPEMESTKTINIYDRNSKLIGTIKDKGKAFVVDTKDKVLKSYIEKGM